MIIEAQTPHLNWGANIQRDHAKILLHLNQKQKRNMFKQLICKCLKSLWYLLTLGHWMKWSGDGDGAMYCHKCGFSWNAWDNR